MIIAVVAVRMVQVAIHKIVDVISVRDCLMAAVGAMLMLRAVSVTLVAVGTVGGIRGVHLELMLVDVAIVKRVQVSVMQVVGVVVVNDRGVAAILAVLMGVVLVNLVLCRHGSVSFEERQEARVIGWGSDGWLFGSMSQAVEDEVKNMLVRQIVKNVFPVASTTDDIVRTQDAKALRNDRDGFTLEFGKLRDTGFSLGETGQYPNPCGLAERTKDPCGPLNGGLVHRDMKTVRSVTLSRTFGLCFNLHKTTISHLHSYASDCYSFSISDLAAIFLISPRSSGDASGVRSRLLLAARASRL